MFRHSGTGRAAGGGRLKSLFVPVAAVAALLAAAAVAQEGGIVASQVEVSEDAALLLLELADGERVAVSFAGGRASVNGAFLGGYEPGGAADREWRGLLGRALSMSGEPLAAELARWRPGPGLDRDERDLLATVRARFAEALPGAGAANAQTPGDGSARRLLEAMSRSEDKEALARALEDMDLESLTVLVGRDRTVGNGTEVEHGFLLVDGELDVRGRVRGDVLVVNGILTVAESGRIDGDVRLVESRLDDSGGEVAGEVTDVTQMLRDREREAEERIRAEVRRQLRQVPQGRARSSGRFAWKVRRAVAVTFDILVFFAFLGLAVWLVAGRARERVAVVVSAIAHQPARSVAVGLAGGFAAVPLYLAGIAALTISVIGILLLIGWVPLVPLAVLAAALIGLAGVSHHVGRWVLARGFRWLTWADRGPPSDGKLLGLATLFAPFVAAEWLKVLPLVGWAGDLLQVAGGLGLLLAAVTGFGAVILTRGGTRPTRPADALHGYGDELDDWGEWSSRGS